MDNNEDLSTEFQLEGYSIVQQLVGQTLTAELTAAIESDATLSRSTNRKGQGYAARNLLENPQVAAFAKSNQVLHTLAPLMARRPFPVRAILFDKPADANWRVPWHQDVMVPVQERFETPGFTAWSVKSGVPHVKPPVEVLEQMLTLRLHLDDCGEQNGPLEVLPGSHQHGYLPVEAIRRMASEVSPVGCLAKRGDGLLMRPLLLHASSKAVAPSHRRVLHVEFACEPLPPPLRWPCPR